MEHGPEPRDDLAHPYRRGRRNPEATAVYGESRRWVWTITATNAEAWAAWKVVMGVARVEEVFDPEELHDGRWVVRFLVVMHCHNKGNHTSDAAHVTDKIDRLVGGWVEHVMQPHSWKPLPCPDPYCPRWNCGRSPRRAIDFVNHHYPERLAEYKASLGRAVRA